MPVCPVPMPVCPLPKYVEEKKPASKNHPNPASNQNQTPHPKGIGTAQGDAAELQLL